MSDLRDSCEKTNLQEALGIIILNSPSSSHLSFSVRGGGGGGGGYRREEYDAGEAAGERPPSASP